MRQLTYLRKNTLEWQDVPAPALRTPDAALVRPFVAARCDGGPLFLHRVLAWAMNTGVALHCLERTTKVVVQRAPPSGAMS